MDDDSIVVKELVLMTFNIRKEVCGVLDYFGPFIFNKIRKQKKTHNMIFFYARP